MKKEKGSKVIIKSSKRKIWIVSSVVGIVVTAYFSMSLTHAIDNLNSIGRLDNW